MYKSDSNIEWFKWKLQLCKRGTPAWRRMRRSLRMYKIILIIKRM